MTELFGIDVRANEDFTPYKWISALEGARYTLDISSYRYSIKSQKISISRESNAPARFFLANAVSSSRY
jgi:hypothetical protein